MAVIIVLGLVFIAVGWGTWVLTPLIAQAGLERSEGRKIEHEAAPRRHLEPQFLAITFHELDHMTRTASGQTGIAATNKTGSVAPADADVALLICPHLFPTLLLLQLRIIIPVILLGI